MSSETIAAIVAMSGTFIVTLAVFVWWISSQFYGLKISIDKGFFKVTTDLNDKHNQNVLRFTTLENRVKQLEQRRGHGV